MRLISQDGMIDVPYENVCVSINYRNKNQITSWNFGCEDYEIVTMATYSNTAKALKVMEMLRDAFAGKFVFKNVDLDDSVFELLKEWKSKGVVVTTNDDTQDVQYINNAIFQFPKDEEIEV